MKFADRIVIMNKGKIVQCDTPQAILRNPANDFVRDFVGTDHTLKQLSLIRIKDVMITEISTLKPTDNIEHAQKLFAMGYRSIVVVDEAGKVKGYVNKEEVGRVSAGQKVSEILTAPISTISYDKSLKEALNTMLRNDAGCLAVVNEHANLVGIITSNCLYKIVGEPYLDPGRVDRAL
ncbi:CBS domain-containing protein [Zhaonella formicivorans]|uniref:CBS domain-containing protein n=1 Tax=Zhaonella formicivorans TaxID=2528593 RepID=UPI002698A658